jgi:lipopolysaccharide export system protein LptA
VHQVDGEVQRAQLEGAPATLRQDLDEGGRVDARARRIDYDLKSDTVVLTGDVVIVQPQGELRGERVTYELATGKMTGSGEGAGSRVRLHIPPKAKSEPATSAD